MTRDYLLRLPTGWDGTTPAPLVLSMHGGGGTADRVSTDDLADLAESEGYIGIYPQGIDKSWNDGRASTPANQMGVDDLGFLAALIDEMVGTYAVDTDRIYATGTSNGGLMSYRLAAEMNATPDGHRLAAVAPTSANMAVEVVEMVDPSQPIHMLMMVGTADPLMPFTGGSNSGEGPGVLSSEATRDYWLAELGLTAVEPTAVAFDDVDMTDSSTVTAEFYNTTVGPDFAYYVVDGGGHAPPGGNQFLANLLNLGPVNQDISAAEEILSFFSARTVVDVFPGDFNLDGSVDVADYTTWRDGLGSTYSMADYEVWRSNYQASNAAAAATVAPEPSSVLLCGLLAALSSRRRVT